MSTGFFNSVEEFVEYSGGDHAIKKILIANNGIGAIKAIRSIRRWSFETFGNERMIKFVAMAAPLDLLANAEYIRQADEVVDVPGGTNNNNYANINLICEIAERLKVDAVMPLWGHASENPSLPTSLLKLKHRVTFIGPPAAPMMALGDKIGSTIIAQSAGVPVIGWNGDDLRVDYQLEGIPQEVYDKANVLTAEEALDCCERIGYPVMIKASEGGGGKGIRKVLSKEEVVNSFKAVQGEIPGSPIFVMKMASHARHLEVQLLADQHGNAVALSGRDCSVQRRHQKIIEEGPPIAAPVSVFKKMEQAAVALAKTVGYVNAGTVEYLYMEQTQEFAFLELNPRLQVEHPVTENILGINLPCCQLQVAMGIPLHNIRDIRRLYGRHIQGRDSIDFDFSERAVQPRHCIAVRITSENSDAGFQPSSGKIKELQFRSAIDVWGYFSVDHSGLIHEFADSQFGHIFASGSTREGARRAMIVALKELSIRGEISTTIEYIIKMLQSQDFVLNQIDTMWLDARLANHKELAVTEFRKFEPPVTLVATAGAALKGYQLFQSRGKDFVYMLGHGHVPAKDTLSCVVQVDLIFQNVKYVTSVVLSGASRVIVRSNSSEQHVSIRQLADDGYLLDMDGQSHVVYSQPEPGGALRMILDGHTCIFTPEYDPTLLKSSVAGKLARLLVTDGSHVDKGDAFVEIEVMKMYMPLRALEPGTVHFQMSEGAALSVGDLIATVRLDDPDTVVKAEVYTGRLDDFKLIDASTSTQQDEAVALRPHLVARLAREKLERVLTGYYLSDEDIESSLDVMLTSIHNKLLPALEVEEALSVLRGRIDADLFVTIQNLLHQYNEQLSTSQSSDSTSANAIEFPAVAILQALQATALALPADKRVAFNNQSSALWLTTEQYLFSPEVRVLDSLLKLLEAYCAVERIFDAMSFTDVVTDLRKEHTASLDTVLSLCRSHVNIKSKNVLLLKVLQEAKQYPLSAIMKQRPLVGTSITLRNEINLRNFKLRLTNLSQLRQPVYSQVSYSANLLLVEQYSISTETRRQKMDDAIVSALSTGENIGGEDRSSHFRKFVETNIVIRDLLLTALHRDLDYQIAAMELYVRKVYNKTHVLTDFVSGSIVSNVSGSAAPFIRFNFSTKFVDAVHEGTTDGSDSPGSPRRLVDSPGCSNRKSFSFTDLAGMAKSMSSAKLSSLSTDSTDMSNTHSVSVFAHPVVPGRRVGVIAKLENLDELDTMFPQILNNVPLSSASTNKRGDLVNGIHIVVYESGWSSNTSDDTGASILSSYLQTQAADLRARGVRRVTFFIGQKLPATLSSPHSPGLKATIFTFRARLGYSEDRLFRHIEAPHAFHLDLPRLSNFTISLEDGIQNASGSVNLYRATPKNAVGSTAGHVRYFARFVSFTADVHSADIETLILGVLDHLSFVIGREEALNRDFRAGSAGNHIFVNIANPDAIIQPERFELELKRLWDKYWYKLVRLGVSNVEFKVSCRLAPDSESLSLRFVATNPTGFVLKIHQYYEAISNDGIVFRSVGNVEGPWEGLSVQAPYPVTQKFERQRAEAMAASDTLYVYDWPALFIHAAEKQFSEYLQNISNSSVMSLSNPGISESVCSFEELVVCDSTSGEPLPVPYTARDIENNTLLPISREPGLNSAGMVGWLVTMKTPDYPVTGRQFVIIANDITHQAGSFGTKEDHYFYQASEYARRRGLPRIYIAANSGARIGMAESLKKLFRVCWSDSSDPSKGFKYIYLSADDYTALLQRFNNDVKSLPVVASPVETEGEVRYVITDIIGEEPDLGVENLMGSGLIAGATSRAYDDIFTLTIVAGRTVGIGAYLVRLGQRTIQKTRNSPIILTGFQALNKLMGREIYTTNDQLGGPMIMFPNGVSHQLADTHMDSVNKALAWISFTPARSGLPLPLRESLSLNDVVDRVVDFAPPKGLSYDPRYLLTGLKSESIWQSGFLDRDSFIETLCGWAKTVVVGRGRLGGLAVGVIVTENRTAEALKPADPADATSHERMVQQAGGVWFPDSAYKTAQALKDFNREGLPCFIFANWRGFSGGQRDMFDEVLKFGSMIVDALVAYQQPLFVYIPPFAELRGGAWVVVDSTINADVMEFYAAEDARGGVLEAAGAATIKFRERDVISTAHRLDLPLQQLDQTIKTLKSKISTATGDEKNDLTSQLTASEQQVKKRERAIFGVYQQIAVHFADLHDTPGRMQAKGVIRRQVDWRDSRRFFFWRLKRRLFEFNLVTEVLAVKPSSATPAVGVRKTLINDFNSWLSSSIPPSAETGVGEDAAFMSTVEKHTDLVSQFVEQRKASILFQELARNVSELTRLVNDHDSASRDSTVALFKSSFASLSSADKSALLAVLQESL